MSSREPGRYTLVALGIGLGLLLFTALVAIELFVEIPSRRIAIQFATAVVLGFAVVKIRTRLELWLADQGASGFDAATAPTMAPSPERTRFHQLYDEVRFGARSQRYFDLVFWPRLLGMAKFSPGERPFEKPEGRSFGRGPAVETIAKIVTAIEARR